MIQIVKITIKDYNSSQSAEKRKALPNRPSVSHNKEQQKKRKNRTKKKTADKGIILFEMDELASYGYSPRRKLKDWKAQYGIVYSIRQDCEPRSKGRRNITLHLTSEEQKDNFEVLIIRFCRRFAT